MTLTGRMSYETVFWTSWWYPFAVRALFEYPSFWKNVSILKWSHWDLCFICLHRFYFFQHDFHVFFGIFKFEDLFENLGSRWSGILAIGGTKCKTLAIVRSVSLNFWKVVGLWTISRSVRLLNLFSVGSDDGISTDEIALMVSAISWEAAASSL